jgi:cysteinyl-tRNA synthetase
VTWVVNITDVDDKLIVRARELGTTVKDLAEKMTNDYFASLKKLNVTNVDQFPRATEHISEMIAMMEGLIEKGHAYAAGGDVYFNIASDPDYGKLCNRDPEQLEAGVRIEVSDKKRNPGDFALWKAAKPGEPAWDSPWGPGRPGWHIECSAMSMKLLGETLDIHGGGLDLQFPHHDAQWLAQNGHDEDGGFYRQCREYRRFVAAAPSRDCPLPALEHALSHADRILRRSVGGNRAGAAELLPFL